MIRFPWKHFVRLLLFQISGLVISFLLGTFFLYVFQKNIFELIFADQYFIFIFLFCAFLFLASAVYIAYKFSYPLGVTLDRVMRISSKSYRKNEEDQEAWMHEELGEYFQLEKVLDRIEKKLKRRKKQALELREEVDAFLFSVEDAIVSVDVNKNINFYNPPFSRYFVSQSNIVFQTNLMSFIRSPDVIYLFDEVLKSGQNKSSLFNIAVGEQKTHKDFHISVTPLRNRKTNEIYGAIGIFHDISEIKQAEKVRTEFVTNASHELKTPLTSIKGYVDILKSDLKQQGNLQAYSFAEVASKNIDRLTILVDDLLALSKIESDKEACAQMVNLDELSQNVLSSFAFTIQQKNQKLKYKGGLGDAFVDPLGIEQVLSNLISNSIKYVPDGGHIEVIWERVGSNLVLRVVDDGPGIPIEHQKRVFERFYRVDRARSREEGGTGLGLAIVKHIVVNHGGNISVRSELNKGTEFICVFPQR